MNILKNLFVVLTVALTTVAVSATQIEYTVHHSPGGPSDRITRYITKDMPARDYIVVNRPGAAGRNAVKHVLSSNSVLMATMTQIYVTNPMNFKDLDYNPNTDLDVLATVAVLPNLLACRAELGITSFKQFLDNTKSFNFAVNGYGSAEHIATEALFKKTKAAHLSVPYAQAGNRGVLDMLGGNGIDCMFANFASIKPFLEDKKFNILFSSHDLGVKVPTWQSYFNEPFPLQNYVALVVAKNMDPSIKKKIVEDVDKVFKSKNYNDDILNIGLLPYGRTDSQSISAVFKANLDLRRFIESSGIKINN